MAARTVAHRATGRSGVAEQRGASGVGYLIEAVDQLELVPRKADYVRLLRRLLIDEPEVARELTPEEETAIAVVLGAVQLAAQADDYDGLLRAVAAGVQLGMRLAAGRPGING